MLVLTRKQQEKIQIGDNITITVLRTKGKAVRLGIEAPETVPVLRGELAAEGRDDQRRQDQPESAAKGATPTPRGVRAEPTQAWESKSAADEEPAVSSTRVSRSRVATVLPKMLGVDSMAAGGPLKAMLDRRAPAPQG